MMDKRTLLAYSTIFALNIVGTKLGFADPMKRNYSEFLKVKFEKYEEYALQHGVAGSFYLGDMSGFRKIESGAILSVSRFDSPIEIYFVENHEPQDRGFQRGLLFKQKRLSMRGFGRNESNVYVSKNNKRGFWFPYKLYKKYHNGMTIPGSDEIVLNGALHSDFSGGGSSNSIERKSKFLFDDSELAGVHVSRLTHLQRYVSETANGGRRVYRFDTGRYSSNISEVQFEICTINRASEEINFVLKRL